jgi:hypothetical protein
MLHFNICHCHKPTAFLEPIDVLYHFRIIKT